MNREIENLLIAVGLFLSIFIFICIFGLVMGIISNFI